MITMQVYLSAKRNSEFFLVFSYADRMKYVHFRKKIPYLIGNLQNCISGSAFAKGILSSAFTLNALCDLQLETISEHRQKVYISGKRSSEFFPYFLCGFYGILLLESSKFWLELRC